MVDDFLDGLVGKVYKILPLSESDNSYLNDYLDSLLIQLNGAFATYPVLSKSDKYVSIVNTINFFSNNKISHKQCKREVFKCIDIIGKLKSEVK